jgi:hypothetical protein
MLPGAQAMCDARRPTDPNLLEEKVDGPDVDLVWRSCGTDSNRPQIAIFTRCSVTPEQLAHAAQTARDVTARIVRECAAKQAAHAALSQALVAAFDAIAPETEFRFSKLAPRADVE